MAGRSRHAAGATPLLLLLCTQEHVVEGARVGAGVQRAGASEELRATIRCYSQS